MFWRGDRIVDLSREFLDTNGCPKKQNAIVRHLGQVQETIPDFTKNNIRQECCQQKRLG